MKRVNISSLYILVTAVILASCNSDGRPEYISKIPGIDSYTYTPVGKEYFEEKRMSLTPGLLISGSEQIENFIGTPFWVEKINEEIWIADPVKGEVLAFEKGGRFARKIASKGGGPGELQQPASIFYDEANPSVSNRVWVLDSGLKGIIQFSGNGQEISRIQNEYILPEFFGNRLIVLQNDTFLVPLMNHEKHVLGVIDLNGDLIDSFVNRIVPLGYQPSTHNRVHFDVESGKKKLAYAYHGLPLVFLEGIDRESKVIYDFRPHQELTEYNIDLTPKPKHERAPVQSVIRDLFINENDIYFRLENDIIIFNYETDRVEYVISMVDKDGYPMVFQQMIYSNGIFFLINRFNSDIHYFSKVSISNM
ncbi:MAG: 6-bladed beta-propeller [Balneolaceae bacterium]